MEPCYKVLAPIRLKSSLMRRGYKEEATGATTPPKRKINACQSRGESQEILSEYE